jgi:hypothetical protein
MGDGSRRHDFNHTAPDAAPLSRPLPHKLHGGEENSIALRMLCRGGGARRSRRSFLDTPNLPKPTPPPKLGEGSPAVARNERKAGRGRGPPAQRAVG